MNIGVVGCGHIFAVGHGPSLALYQKEYRNNTLFACCDIDENMRRKAVGIYGFKHSFSTIDDMLKNVRPDAVVLCLPPAYTANAAIRLMEEKIPVLIEKPPGRDISETRKLIETAHRTGTPHAVAFNRRSIPLLTAFKATLEGKQLRYINLDFFRYRRAEKCFYETAIHGIDALSFMAGSHYAELSVTYDPNPIGGGDDFRIEGHLENGTAVHMAFYPQSGDTLERFTVCANNYIGKLHLPVWGAYDSPGSATVFADENSYEIKRAETDMYITNGFYHQMKNFLSSVESGVPLVNTLDSCMQSMEIMDALKCRKTKICFDDMEGI